MRAAKGEAFEFIQNAVKYDGDECLLWPFGIGSHGYGMIGIPGNNGTTTAHSMVCEAAHGEAPLDKEVAHRCGNRRCVNPKHLRWATRVENSEDKRRHGRLNSPHIESRGEKHHGAKLSEADVLIIREDDRLHRVIAAEYGIHKSLVSHIKRQKCWSWL